MFSHLEAEDGILRAFGEDGIVSLPALMRCFTGSQFFVGWDELGDVIEASCFTWLVRCQSQIHWGEFKFNLFLWKAWKAWVFSWIVRLHLGLSQPGSKTLRLSKAGLDGMVLLSAIKLFWDWSGVVVGSRYLQGFPQSLVVGFVFGPCYHDLKASF